MIERALPLVILVVAGVYLSQAMQLPFGTTARPGPGFYPVVVAVFACLVALVASVQAFRAPVAVGTVEEADAETPAGHGAGAHAKGDVVDGAMGAEALRHAGYLEPRAIRHDRDRLE